MANSTIKAIRPNWNAGAALTASATKTYNVPDGFLMITKGTSINMLFCIAHSSGTRFVKTMANNGSYTNAIDVSIDTNDDVKIVNSSGQSVIPLFYY